MGTRADFYIGKGKNSEWLGSIAWDGYPKGIPTVLLRQTNEKGFRANVSKFLDSRDDATLPNDGWPWPWEDSGTTDYAYTLSGDKVLASCFGSAWFDPKNPPKEPKGHATLPNMADRQNIQWGKK